MDRLKPHEMDALGAFLMHYIDMDMRHRLMTELPTVYNKLVGRRVVLTALACVGCERTIPECTCPRAQQVAS